MKDEAILLEVGVKVFLRRSDGRYLVLKRSKPYPGQKIKKWDVPGGRIHPGETLEKALAREVREETNLRLYKVEKVLSAQDILRVPGKHTVRITYVASIKDHNKLKLDQNEHIDFKWATLSELKKLRYDFFLTPVIPLL